MEPVPRAAGRRWAPPRQAVSGGSSLSSGANAVSPPLLRYVASRRQRSGHPPVGGASSGPATSRSRLGPDASVARALGSVPVHRERRADLLLVRLGVAATRSGLHRNLPRASEYGAADAHLVVSALAAVPSGVRRRAYQGTPRPLLEGSHLPLLPP